ncbi:MAG: dUTPase [crAssphage sp. isolate ctcc615]|uniref:dUTP diphosphatase n=1 Tax=crAssphage sp. isolate ctcc615 TaxID=2989853 RepID=A0A345BP44_9CAUD|nr:MAG: dUTPase [crAssphage sp. isolate ctcc615]AXF52215.1 MAG: dUTPase [crAssphage sp. isolate ctcc615]
MEVKIKKLSKDAIIPSYAHDTDAGLDFVATSYEYKEDIDCHVFGTGLAIEIPEGHVGLCFPRSSNRKTDLYLTNSVGVIDAGYRGEIMASFKNRDFTPDVIANLKKGYELGDRVFQMIILPYPKIEFVEADYLSDSERGTGGHGSTGA